VSLFQSATLQQPDSFQNGCLLTNCLIVRRVDPEVTQRLFLLQRRQIQQHGSNTAADLGKQSASEDWNFLKVLAAYGECKMLQAELPLSAASSTFKFQALFQSAKFLSFNCAAHCHNWASEI
jgi:hypothetical protein